MGARAGSLLRRVAAALGQAADVFSLRESVRAIAHDLYGASVTFEPTLRIDACAEPLTAQDEEAIEIAGLYLDAATLRLSQAFVDPLTGIANRRRFDEALQSEWARCARSQTPLCVIVVDVDFFGAYNECYGHQAGDDALRAVAKTVAEAARRHGDLAARYGGEEFALILPDATLQRGAAIALDLCRRIEALHIPHEWTTLGRLTLSCGAEAQVPAVAEASAKAFVERADEALFRAKHGGRNRAVAGLHEDGGAPNGRRYPVHHNLPGFAGDFVGRHDAVRSTMQALQGSRFITICGPGGAGKTRLACEVAAQAATGFKNGVIYVDIAGALERAEIISALARALQTTQRAGESLEDSVFSQLASGERLLVLDNCEQAQTACIMLVNDVLARSGAHIIATSRITFGVRGERALELGPLRPDEASRLFQQRMRLGAEAANEDLLDRLWRRIDPLPLVVEVLAARSDDIANVDADAMMQTFREVVDWSYRLLDAEEKRVLRALGVFTQSFDMAAAAAVAALQESAALRLLQRLAHKSLVQFDPRTQHFRLLELTRSFAREELDASGEALEVRARHLEHFRAVTVRIHKRFDESRAAQAVELTRANLTDIRAALAHASSLEHYHAAAAEMIAYLALYWQFTGHVQEAREYFAIADRCAKRAGPSIRAHLAYGKASVMYAAGDMQAVREHAREAASRFEQTEDRLWLAHAQRLLAVGSYDTDLDEAERLLQQSLNTFRQCGHRGGTASALINLGVSMMDRRGDRSRARPFFEEALTIPGEGWSASRCVARLNLSELAYVEGDYEKSLALATESAGEFDALDNQFALVSALKRIPALLELERYSEAAAALRSLSEAIEVLGAVNDVCAYVEEVARLAWSSGDAPACLELLAFRRRYRSENGVSPRYDYVQRLETLEQYIEERLDTNARERLAESTSKWSAGDAVARTREVLANL